MLQAVLCRLGVLNFAIELFLVATSERDLKLPSSFASSPGYSMCISLTRLWRGLLMTLFPPASYIQTYEQFVLEHVLQAETKYGPVSKDPTAGLIDHVHMQSCACCSPKRRDILPYSCRGSASCSRKSWAACNWWPPSWGPALYPAHVERMYQQYAVESSSYTRRGIYVVCFFLGLYYFLDSVVFDVHDPKFPELRPDRVSYQWAIVGRSLQMLPMVVCFCLYWQHHTMPGGVLRLAEVSMWMLTSIGQHIRASISTNPVEFSRFVTGWGSLVKLGVAVFSGAGFELTVVFCLFDSIGQNYTQYQFDPLHSRFASLQWSIVNAILGIAASVMIERSARETFLLRLRLYLQLVRGANAALSQHGMLEGSPAAVVLVGAGYATVRPDVLDIEPIKPTRTPVLGSGVEEPESRRRAMRIDLHRSPVVVVSTTGLERILDGLQGAFQRHGIRWVPGIGTEVAQNDRSLATRDEEAHSRSIRETSSGGSHAPMLHHTGKDLVGMLGVCRQDRPLAYWALFCASERQDEDFRAAALRTSMSHAVHSVSLLRGMRRHAAFEGVGMQKSDDSKLSAETTRKSQSEPSRLGRSKVWQRGVNEGGSNSERSESQSRTSHRFERPTAGFSRPAEVPAAGTVAGVSVHRDQAQHSLARAPGRSLGASIDRSSMGVEDSRQVTYLDVVPDDELQDSQDHIDSMDVSVLDWTHTGTASGPRPADVPREAGRVSGDVTDQREEGSSCRSAAIWSDTAIGCNPCCCLAFLCDMAPISGPVRELGGPGDLVLQLSERLTELFLVSRTAASVGAVLELRPLEQVRVAVEPWQELQRMKEQREQQEGGGRARRSAGLERVHTEGPKSVYGDVDVIRAVQTPPTSSAPALRRYGSARKPVPREHSFPGVPFGGGHDPRTTPESRYGSGSKTAEGLPQQGERLHEHPVRSSHEEALVAVGGEALVATGSLGRHDAGSSDRAPQLADSGTASTAGASRSDTDVDVGVGLEDVDAMQRQLKRYSPQKLRQQQPIGVEMVDEASVGRARVHDDTDLVSSHFADFSVAGGDAVRGDSSTASRPSEAEPASSSAHGHGVRSSTLDSGGPGLLSPSRGGALDTRRRGSPAMALETTVASRMRLVQPPEWESSTQAQGLLRRRGAARQEVAGRSERSKAWTEEGGQEEHQASRVPPMDPGRNATTDSAVVRKSRQTSIDTGASSSLDDSSETGAVNARGNSEGHAAVQEMVEVRRRFRGLIASLQPQGQVDAGLAQGGAGLEGAQRARQGAEGYVAPLSGGAVEGRTGGDNGTVGGSGSGGPAARPTGSQLEEPWKAAGWPILRATDDERHVVLRVGLGATVVAEVYLVARRHEGGAVVSLTLMS